MRFIKSAFAVLMMVALTVSAVAQSENSLGLRYRIGWATTGTFTNFFNNDVNISGPEFGIDVPISRTNQLEFYLSGSVIGGGRLSSGSDTDGEIFKLLLSVKGNLDRRGTYLQLGAGFATLNPRSPTFSGATGFVGRIAIGIPINNFLGKSGTAIEVATIVSGEGQLRGMFYGFTGKL